MSSCPLDGIVSTRAVSGFVGTEATSGAEPVPPGYGYAASLKRVRLERRPTIRWLWGETLDRDRSPVTSPGEA